MVRTQWWEAVAYKRTRNRIMAERTDPIALAAAARMIVELQNACQHKNVEEWQIQIDGKLGYQRQCRDCAMFNPPAYGQQMVEK